MYLKNGRNILIPASRIIYLCFRSHTGTGNYGGSWQGAALSCHLPRQHGGGAEGGAGGGAVSWWPAHSRHSAHLYRPCGRTHAQAYTHSLHPHVFIRVPRADRLDRFNVQVYFVFSVIVRPDQG
jgi:hypothetical protein